MNRYRVRFFLGAAILAAAWVCRAGQADSKPPAPPLAFSALDLGTGNLVLLTLEPPSDRTGLAGVLILRREDSTPHGPKDQKAKIIYRGPPLCVHFDREVVLGRVFHYVAFSFDEESNYSAGLCAEVRVGGLPVSGLVVTDPGLGNRLELRWTNPPAAALTDRLRILRFSGGCAEGPDPDVFERRVDLPLETAGRQQTFSDEEVKDAVAYCYAVYVRTGVSFSAGVFASGKSSDRTPPRPVSDLVARPSLEAGERSVELRWTNPSDADLAEVRILRRSGAAPAGPDDPRATPIYRGLEQLARDGEVADGVEYRYRAWALDEAANASQLVTISARRPFIDDDGDGYGEEQGDCDDANPRAFPGAESRDCSATDWDCDGRGWEDAFCRASAPAGLDPQCTSRPGPYRCRPGFGCDWHEKRDHTPCSSVTEPDYNYDICVSGVCRSPGSCNDSSCNSPGPHFRPPPAAGHADFDRASGKEPVVVDRITGLMWQGCPAGLGGDDCSAGRLEERDWKSALDYCDGLSWAGHSDWHLPDRYELLSLVDHGRTRPAAETKIFPATAAYFWTSSSNCGDSTIAWQVFFDSGNVSYALKSYPCRVRCVRTDKRIREAGTKGKSGAAGDGGWRRFVRNEAAAGQPVVDDSVTGLQWQGCPLGLSGSDCRQGRARTLDWSEASAACAALQWGGHGDWYLPEVNQLDSIVDSRQRSPAIDPAAFPGTPTGWYWTATEYANDARYAWHANFGSGHLANFDKQFVCYVRCARRAK